VLADGSPYTAVRLTERLLWLLCGVDFVTDDSTYGA
jgi:hypothetical protein